MMIPKVYCLFLIVFYNYFFNMKSTFCLLSKVEELFKLWSPLYDTYVALVEDLINDGFTRHQRDEDLSYGKYIIEEKKLFYS